MKVTKLLFIVLVLLSVGCTAPSEQPRAVFRTLGSWDMPPMYNGNPFAPGGVGAARDFIYGPLFGYDVFKNEFWPWVALRFEETSNTLTVQLRHDLSWEDGIPFTSKDVYATFVLHGGLGEWSEVWKYIDRIDTPDSFTVVFRYGSANSILSKFFILTNMIDASNHVYEKWVNRAASLLKLRKKIWRKETELGKAAKHSKAFRELSVLVEKRTQSFRKSLQDFRPEMPMGYGPFRLKKVNPDEMILEKSAAFWAAKKIPFDEIRIGRFTTNELVWASFIAGEVDIEKPATSIDVVEAILKAQPKIKHIPVSDFTAFCLVINNEKFPFNQKKFRKALAYIIDRDKVRMVALYYGTKVEYPCGILPSVLHIWTTSEFRKHLNPYQVDLAKAKKLLKDIGLVQRSNGFWTTKEGKILEFEIATSPNTDWVLAAEEISRELTAFGLKTNVRIIEATLYGPTLGAGKYDMAIEFGVAAKFHPVQGYQNLYSPKGRIASVTGFPLKVVCPKGGKLDLEQLQEQLFKTFDRAKQREIIKKLAWATNEYLPVIDLVEKNAQFFVCDGVRVTGWPYGEELRNKFAFNWRIASLKWMIEGILKPGEVRVK